MCVMYMWFFVSLERNGSRFLGARLKGAGGSASLDDEEVLVVEDVVLKARAFPLLLGGILADLAWAQGGMDAFETSKCIR